MSQTPGPEQWEILKMARDIVINEYTDRRAQLHNQWITQSQQAKQRGQSVPYPDIPAYPTEEQIVARAQTLMKFLRGEITVSDTPTNTAKSESAATVEPVPQSPVQVETTKVQPEPTITSKPEPDSPAVTQTVSVTETCDDQANVTPNTTSVTDSVSSQSKTREQELADLLIPDREHLLNYANHKVKEQDLEFSTSTGRILPSLIKKLEEIRKSLG